MTINDFLESCLSLDQTYYTQHINGIDYNYYIVQELGREKLEYLLLKGSISIHKLNDDVFVEMERDRIKREVLLNKEEIVRVLAT